MAAAVVLTVAVWPVSHEIVEAYAYRFEKVSIPGVPNAGRVNAHLFRGGQPTEAGLAALRSRGVDTVVSFTLEGEGARIEADEVRALGMEYIHLPWSANDVPPADYVKQFLELTGQEQSRIVFVHCKAGSDRTGLMIGVYRILAERWTVEHALDEMDAFGYEVMFHPQLRQFVRTVGSAPRH